MGTKTPYFCQKITEKNASKNAYPPWEKACFWIILKIYLGEVRLGWVGLGNIIQPFIEMVAKEEDLYMIQKHAQEISWTFQNSPYFCL